MEVVAKHKYLRISATKVRLVAGLIRKVPVVKALAILQFTNKASAKPMRKVLLSALANAKNNFGMKEDTLVVKSVQIDVAPTLKRFLPRAQGRANSLLKRASHITIVIEERT